MDLHRLPSSFNIGDQVWLLRRHIKSTRPCEKLDYQRLGFFILSVKLMMSLFVSIYLHNFGCIRCFIVLSSNPIKRAPSQDGRIIHPPPPIELEDGGTRHYFEPNRFNASLKPPSCYCILSSYNIYFFYHHSLSLYLSLSHSYPLSRVLHLS